MRIRIFRKNKGEETSARKPGGVLDLRSRWRVKISSWRAVLLTWLSIIFLSALIAVPIVLFIWLVFFTDMFNVQAVTVVDAREHTIREARQIINEQVEGGPLGQNIFFVQTDSIEQAILAKLSQVKTVHVVRKLPATIKAIIQEKEPAILLLSAGKYYFVDENGIAYERAMLDTLPGYVLTTVKNDDESTSVSLGVVTVQPALISFLRLAEEELPEAVGAKLGEVYVPSLAAREVRIVLENNWTILFDVTRSPEAQMGVLKSLLQNTATPEELEVMEYIDLRVPNRVYYRTRLREEAQGS